MRSTIDSIKHNYFKLLREVIAEARKNPPVAVTPKEQFELQHATDLWWEHLHNDVESVFGDFVEQVVEIMQQLATANEQHAAGRTELLEQAIERMTVSLITYPSTPHTESTVNNLAGALKALQISMDIDDRVKVEK